MKYCHKCGFYLKFEETIYCPSCGVKLVYNIDEMENKQTVPTDNYLANEKTSNSKSTLPNSKPPVSNKDKPTTNKKPKRVKNDAPVGYTIAEPVSYNIVESASYTVPEAVSYGVVEPVSYSVVKPIVAEPVIVEPVIVEAITNGIEEKPDEK